MKCPSEQELHDYVVGEVEREEQRIIMVHLQQCADCQAAVQRLHEDDQWLQLTLKETLKPAPHHINVDQAWEKFQTNVYSKHAVTTKPKWSWKTMKTSTKRMIQMTAAAAALAGALTIPQVQSAAADFLGLFRVKEVALVKITQDDLTELSNALSNPSLANKDLQLGDLAKVELSDFNEQSTRYFDSGEQFAKAGFKALQVEGYSLTSATVNEPMSVTFTLNIDKVNALLKQLGGKTTFQQELDGKPFTIKVGQAVEQHLYRDAKMVSYVTANSPEIEVPNGVDVFKLRATLLNLPFLPENIKRQLASIENWQQTLPIPMVEVEQGQLDNVMVAGQKVQVLTTELGTSAFWTTGTNIHFLGGEKMTKDELVALVKQAMN